MAAERSPRTIQLSERASSTHSGAEEALSKWLVFSFLVHGLFIASLFIVPFLPSSSGPSHPVYTVDLVGGDKIGGMKLGTESTPSPPQKQKAEKVQPEPSAPVPETKKETKREKTKQVEKVASPPEKALPKEVVKKEPTKKEPVKETKNESKEIKSDSSLNESKTERGLSEETREKLIQAALDRVKDRAATGQKPGTAKSEGISTGPGEGEGAAAIGPGGRGGGIVKGPEFISYYNKMLSTIRENWTWPGQRADLKTTVQFGIRENGELVGLRIVQASGDPSYDDSVLRAVRKSSPLVSPPEAYRRDFADVKLTFRPEDLGGSGR